MPRWISYPLHTLHAKVFSNLLAAAGFDVTDPMTWDTVTLEAETMPREVAVYAKKNRRALEELGIPVRADVAKNAVQLVGAVLAKMSVRL